MITVLIVNYLVGNNSNNKYNNSEIDKHEYLNLLQSLVFIIAIYLSFNCNKGFYLSSFAGALFFPEIYIIYKLATGCK